MDHNSSPKNFKVCATCMEFNYINLRHIIHRKMDKLKLPIKLIKILKKTYESNKFSDWLEKLIDALWAYRTSILTPTRQTSYALMFGMEAVLPYEIFLPSLRVQLDQEISESEHREALLVQLELLDERHLRAAEHVQVYQNLLSKFYQKKIIERKFEIGDMVVK